MKKLMLIAGLTLAAFTGAHAEDSQYGGIDDFYSANIDVDSSQYAGRVVNPGYFLVEWGRWNELGERLSGAGYVQLGYSSWNERNGVPEKNSALAYARALGATIVIYMVRQHPGDDYRSDHCVGFYAKQAATAVRRAAPANRPTSAEATAAINRAQDAWHEPRVKGGVWYDPQTDTYNWTGPKFGERRSKSAEWFLDHFGAYL